METTTQGLGCRVQFKFHSSTLAKILLICAVQWPFVPLHGFRGLQSLLRRSMRVSVMGCETPKRPGTYVHVSIYIYIYIYMYIKREREREREGEREREREKERRKKKGIEII